MDDFKVEALMKLSSSKQIIFLFALLIGWISLSITIYENFIRVNEDELENFVHEVPSLYKNQYGMEFVYIKPGSFKMGNEEDHPYKVFITNGFYIQKTEVTQSHWKKVIGSNPSHFKNCGPDCPVEMITKDDANSFLRILNNNNDETNFTYRLPTEAEWEYTVYSGNNIVYENAEELKNQLEEYGWYSKNSFETTHPVASKKPNAFGIYDLQGNVYEWCADVYNFNHNKENIKNPLNKIGDKSGNHVVRGGGWRSFYYYCRVGTKAGRLPNSRHNDVGLRVVIEIKDGVPTV